MNSTEYIPAAVPSLIDAAVLAFDADRDTSRRYLLRASALLGVKRGTHSAESTKLSLTRTAARTTMAMTESERHGIATNSEQGHCVRKSKACRKRSNR